MATVIGVFDDENGVTKARDALEQAGYGDDVVEVIDGGLADTNEVGSVIGNASGLRGGGIVNPSSYPGGLGRANIDDDEKAFFYRSVQDGAKLIILNTDGDDARDIEVLMKQAGAGRVQVDD